MGRPYTIIVNPTAGRGRTGRFLPRLRDALAASRLDFEVAVSAHPDHLAELAHDAFNRGRTVVACGGDGTVSAIAAVAADRRRVGDDAVVGILPAGAGNDFARALGLDHRQPLRCLDTLETGSPRRVDLGRVAGRWYCCVASAGFDAEANRWANTVTRLHGTTLYVAAVLRTLVTYRPRPFRLTVDGTARDVEAWLVAVANAPTYGGGMRIAPEARLDDGLLDLTVVGPVGRLDFLRTFPRVFRGTHVRHPLVTTLRAREVTVEALEPGDAYADGERVGPLPFTATAVPGALEVLTPQPGP